MIDALLTTKIRIKLITRLFRNSKAKSHLRGLAGEFGDSSNAIRLELNRFEKAGLLTTSLAGNKKNFQANTQHPLYTDIQDILLKHLGFDQIIQKVVEGLGDIRRVYITRDYACGRDNGIINLLFVGNHVDTVYLANLVEKAEELIKRTVQYAIKTESEETDYLIGKGNTEFLLLWQENK